MGGSEMPEVVIPEIATTELIQYNRCNKTRIGDRSDNANICVRLPNHKEDKCAFIDFRGDLIIDWCDPPHPPKRREPADRYVVYDRYVIY